MPKRRRDAAATKARILAAAKTCFSEVGYAGTGIRDVAAAADVSYALLGRYFGSKAGLFEAALTDNTNIGPVIAGPRSRFGETLARLIAGNPSAVEPTAMTILGAADPVARDIAMRVVEKQIVQPLAAWIGEPCGRERAIALVMLGGGFVVYARQLPLIGQGVGIDHPTVGWLARSFQDIIDDPASWRRYADGIGETR